MKTIVVGWIDFSSSRIKLGCRIEQLGFGALSAGLNNVVCNVDK